MPLKYSKPITPGQRGRVSLDFASANVGKFPKEISEFPGSDILERGDLKAAVKYLQAGRKESAGRNNQGRITVRYRGGGHKRNQRHVLFQRHVIHDLFLADVITSQKYTVQGLIYDPSRAASLALISTGLFSGLECSKDTLLLLKKRRDVFVLNLDERFRRRNDLSHETKKSPERTGYVLFFFIIAPQFMKSGQSFSYESFESLDISPGKVMRIEHVPLGSVIHNVEIHSKKGGQLVRAAGAYAQVLEKSIKKNRVRIRLPSGAQRWILFGSLVTLGSVSNEEQRHVVIAKAGRKRWLSKKPRVRGVAMNPVDHPHGGGEGRTSGGRPSVTPWGRPTHRFSLRVSRGNPFIIS